jgi:hypothetical protein
LRPSGNPPLRDVVNVPFATPKDLQKLNGDLKPGTGRIASPFRMSLARDIPIVIWRITR